MKKICVAALALCVFVGCGSSNDFTSEQQAAADAATAFYLDVGEARWDQACRQSSKSYIDGAENLVQILNSLSKKGLAKERVPKSSCSESLERLVTSTSPTSPGRGYEDPEISAVTIKGGSAKVSMKVSNSSYFGDRSGKGSSNRIFLMAQEGGGWKFVKLEASEDQGSTPEPLAVPGK